MRNGMKRVNNALELLMGPRMYTLKVVEIQNLNRYMKKIRFIGNLSKLNFQKAYAMNIHLGAVQSKGYSASFLDVENGVLESIFHIDGTTLESVFIDNLKIADEIRVSTSRSQILYNPDNSRYFIFGDETSLGLAYSFLPLFKNNKQKYHYYFELDHKNHKTPLLLGLENYSIYPKDGSFTNEKWVSELLIFNSEGWREANYILTGDIQSVKSFRNVLKKKSLKGKIFA